MNRLFCAILALLPPLAASLSHAAVFERDWKAPGDGLLTYDNVNGREWLDVTYSRIDQFPAPKLQNAIAEISPGGLFEGFTFAKPADVSALAESAGIDLSTFDYQVNSVPAGNLAKLLGPTLAFENVSFHSVAFIDQIEISRGLQYGAVIYANPFNSSSGRAGVSISWSDDFLSRDYVGLMLYRVAVPEPSSIGIGLTGLVFMYWVARGRRNRLL